MRIYRKTKFISFVLTLILILTALPMSVASVEQAPQFIIGEEIYHPTLTGVGNGVPEGWLAGPEKYVPWLNIDGANGWENFNANGTTNGEINPEVFTYTKKGLAVSLGSCDFTIVFPALVDSDNTPVTDYVYTIELADINEASEGSIGPVTHAAGGMDYRGGAYLMAYLAPGSKNTHRYYTFENRARLNNVYVAKNTDDAIVKRTDGTMTITVYHCNNNNYYFVNGKYLFSQIASDCYNGAPLNGIGMNFCGAVGVTITDISVRKAAAKGISDRLSLLDASVRYCDADGNTEGEKAQGLRFSASVDKTSELYKYLVPEKTYNPANEKVKFGMLILPTDLLPESKVLDVNTPTVVDTVISKLNFQDEKALNFSVSLLNIPTEQQARSFTARVYVKELVDGEWKYTYSLQTMSLSFCGVANLDYENTESKAVRKRLTDIFSDCPYYEGPNAKTLTFAALADFHYKQGMYMSSIADMQAILDRAHNADAEFIIHAGDFCNDYAGSPELMNTYLNNNYGMTALGVYGNHELETKGNNMEIVSGYLTNCNVVWGTEDGKIGDGSIGYYYYDLNGFRIVCPDTNYSYDNTNKYWEHNLASSNGPPSGNSYANSLGPTQLEWLRKVLMDAADKDMSCIVVAHVGFSGVRSSSPDAEAVREIYKDANEKRPGTVLLSINGHFHSNHIDVVDEVMYIDLNTSRNGAWRSTAVEHYTDETFKFVEYDTSGKPISTSDKKLNDLSMGKKTWFFEDPLSAIITVSTSGRIIIDGAESDWISDLTPPTGLGNGEEPKITSGTFDLMPF